MFYSQGQLLFRLSIKTGYYKNIKGIVDNLNEIIKNCPHIVKNNENNFLYYDHVANRVRIMQRRINVDFLKASVVSGKKIHKLQNSKYDGMPIFDLDDFKSFLKEKDITMEQYLEKRKIDKEIQDYELNSHIYTEKKEVDKIVFENRLGIQLGFPINTNILEHDESVFPTQLDFGIPNQFFIYTDIIDYQLIGHTYAKIIKIVTVDFNKSLTFGTSISKEFTKIQYVKLSNFNFDEISVYIKDAQNNYIPFVFGVLTIILHFIEEE